MLELILTYMAILGGASVVLNLLLALFGVGDTTPTDLDIDSDIGDYDGGLKIFTLQGISAFLFIMGITGLGLLHASFPVGWAITLAFMAGIGVMYLMAYIFKLSKKLDSDGTIKIEDAVGRTGTVYLPMNTQNIQGVVQINMNGATREYDSISHTGETISVGDLVTVESVSGNLLRVRKTN